MSFQQRGSVIKSPSSKGIEYVWTIQVDDANRDTYIAANGADIAAYQTDYPTDTIVCNTSRCRGGGDNVWFITYFGMDSIDYSFSLVPRKKNKSYSTGEFQMTPHMLGVKVMQDSDVTAGYYNIDGLNSSSAIPAKAGDWMYANSTTADTGTPDYEACPFDTSTWSWMPSAALIKLMLATPMRTAIYTVRFTDSRTTADDFLNWNGTNGSFGSGLAPSTATTGLWMARWASSETVTRGSSVSQYVTRKMETAPKFLGVQFLWDTTKYPAWTW